MENLFICLPVFILFLALYITTKYLLQKLQNFPPSPFPALPLIGHLYLLKKPFHRALSVLSKQYGPVLFLQFGSRPVLLISSPLVTEECFTKNDIIFANRPFLLGGKYFGYNYTSLAWSPYGNHWRNLRRIASIELLSSHRVQMLSHIQRAEMLSLIRKLFNQTRENRSKCVEMKSALSELTFNVMTRMINGKKYSGKEIEDSKEAQMFVEIITETTRVAPDANVLDFLPFMRWFGLKYTEKKLMEIQEKRDKFMQDVIEEHRGVENDDDPCYVVDSGLKKKTMIQVLLDLQREEPENYTDETIRNLLLVLVQGGTSTSADTLEWAFSLLLDNPEIMKRAQAEIDNRIGKRRLVNESDVSDLPYLRHIINETLRMHPPVPLLLPHLSSEDCMVAGFRIPRGTILLVNLWHIHHDPNIWEDPEKFKPERFEDLQIVKNDFKFLPFGLGRRACPGENLAVRMLVLALTSLIQCFDWEKVSEIVDMAEGTGLTASKIEPLSAMCNLRSFVVNFLS